MPTSGAVGRQRHSPQVETPAAVGERQIKPAANRDRQAEGQEPVQRHRRAEDVDAIGEIGIGMVVAAEYHEHDALDNEEQPEGRQNGINFQTAGAARTAHQRPHHDPVDDERQAVTERHDDEKRPERRQAITGKQHEGDEGSRNQHFAIGKVHDAGNAILQRKSKRDQRIGPSQHQAEDEGG